MLDILEERARFFLEERALSRDAVFLRFGRCVTGAVRSECNAAMDEDSAGVSGPTEDATNPCASPRPSIRPRECGAEVREDSSGCGAEVREDSSGFTGADGASNPCASPRPSIRPRPKANLNMTPYHLSTESAVSSDSAAGAAIGVRL